MQKVISINLNGRAYQVDEDGFSALVAYLERAERRLEGHPDRAEIMADLEQAIADKCDTVLHAHKTVVGAAEVGQIILDMGPVEVETNEARARGTEDGTSTKEERDTPRRLYQIREGAMVSGVCNGLGAYFNLDPTIIRVVFVVLAIVTSGAWLVVYAVLMLVLPYAKTPEERAAAAGLPFNAQEIIDRVTQAVSEAGEAAPASSGG